MHRLTRRTRPAAFLFAAAFAACEPSPFAFLRATEFGPCHAKDPNEGGGGGNPDPSDAEPVTLTKAELKKQIEAAQDEALRAEREKSEKQRQKDKEAAEKKKAEEEGEFKELAYAEQQKREAAEKETASLRMSLRLRDYLAENQPGYVGCAKYIQPTIDAAAEPEDVTKAIKKAVEQYVKDNPRQASAAPTPGPGRSGLPSGTRPPKKDGGNVSGTGDPIRDRVARRYAGPPGRN